MPGMPRFKKVFFAVAVHGKMTNGGAVSFLRDVFGDVDLQNRDNQGRNIANQFLAQNMDGKQNQGNGKPNSQYIGSWYIRTAPGTYNLACENPNSLESRCRFLRNARGDRPGNMYNNIQVFSEAEIRSCFDLCCQNDPEYRDDPGRQAELRQALGIGEINDIPVPADEQPPAERDELLELLKSSFQLILTGAPGTGKTYRSVQLAENWIEETGGTKEENLCQIQFHPGYDYSDFIIGIKPEVVEDNQTTVTFSWKAGMFKEFADKAKAERENAIDENRSPKPYIFIIDEINRADLSRVFGEVFSLLEEEYRFPHRITGIKLPNGKNFILPDNLYIIGTMNDIDRSVESMDFALRRRFAWHEVKAEDSYGIIDAADDQGNYKIREENDREKLKRVMEMLNKYIDPVGDQGPEPLTVNNGQPVSLNLGEEYQLGGAYFLKFAKYQDEADPWELLWNNHIAVILNEYLRGKKYRTELLSRLHQKFNDVCDAD